MILRVMVNVRVSMTVKVVGDNSEVVMYSK